MPDERKSPGLVGVRDKTPLKQAANIGVTGFMSAKSSRRICTDLLGNSSPHNKRLSIQETDKLYWVLRTEKMLWLGRSPTCFVHTSHPRQILTSGLCSTDPQPGLRPPPRAGASPDPPQEPCPPSREHKQPCRSPQRNTARTYYRKHQTPATKIIFKVGGGLRCTWNWGEKNQALRHMHPLPDLKWQQGSLSQKKSLHA